MKRIITSFFAATSITLLTSACSERQNRSAENPLTNINAEEQVGNFTNATRLIDMYIAENDLSADAVYELQWRKDKMRRITLDFNQDKDAVVRYIRKYYPEVNDSLLNRWEREKSLEYRVIDGEKKYFERAAANLFRINPEAAARKSALDAPKVDYKEKTLVEHLPEVVKTATKNGKPLTEPVQMVVKYEITLNPNAVPDGEIVRCWLPYPREDNQRQTAVKLLSANADDYIIAPVHSSHRTLYMEKIARKDEPLTFAIKFSFQSSAEWFNLASANVPPYDANSDLYKLYTAERPPHIVFSDSIKAISKRIVGNETDVFKKLQKIFVWVDEQFPWAGAREYSTIDNIPSYVLENGHGDCGQVTLLFIALARYNGVPARWQSGFMLHPRAENLHDWGEFYVEGKGWIPVDQSFGVNRFADDNDVKYFYSNGIDAYRLIVNNDYSQPLFPAKIYPRSETVDFQRGELEWRGGNLYFDKWTWRFESF